MGSWGWVGLDLLLALVFLPHSLQPLVSEARFRKGHVHLVHVQPACHPQAARPRDGLNHQLAIIIPLKEKSVIASFLSVISALKPG